MRNKTTLVRRRFPLVSIVLVSLTGTNRESIFRRYCTRVPQSNNIKVLVFQLVLLDISPKWLAFHQPEHCSNKKCTKALLVPQMFTADRIQHLARLLGCLQKQKDRRQNWRFKWPEFIHDEIYSDSFWLSTNKTNFCTGTSVLHSKRRVQILRCIPEMCESYRLQFQTLSAPKSCSRRQKDSLC